MIKCDGCGKVIESDEEYAVLQIVDNIKRQPIWHLECLKIALIEMAKDDPETVNAIILGIEEIVEN
jgi:hypothetical protein